MEDIQAKIDKTRDELLVKKENLEKSIKLNEDMAGKLWKAKESATKDLEEQVERIETPYNQQLKTLETQKRDLEQQKWRIERAIVDAPERIKGEAAESLEEFPDAESFRGWMKNRGIGLNFVKMVGKKLTNGVTLFRHTYYEDATYASVVTYFAVKGKKIVGFHHVEKARHQGDTSTYMAWINAKNLVFGNTKERDTKERGTYGGLRLREWKAKMEKQTKFVAADPRNEDNRKRLAEC